MEPELWQKIIKLFALSNLHANTKKIQFDSNEIVFSIWTNL